MTLTINLESDVLAAAETLAKRERCTLDAVVNQVLRQTLIGTPPSDVRPSKHGSMHLTIEPETGLPSVKCSEAFNSEDVYRVEASVT